MINVEAEVSKHKNCKNRDELTRLINDYKSLALKNAHDLVLAGQYTTVAAKLKEICDKLSATHLKKIPGSDTHNVQVKTVAISDEENAKIKADWEKRAKK